MSELTPTDETFNFDRDGDNVFTFKNWDGIGEIQFMAVVEESVGFVTRSWWRRRLFNLAGGGRVVAFPPKQEGT